ncbi:MAG TPA: hypothetical protein VLG67_03825, partial [Candidatus Saccharimonadales bacterium]|nr:hypothetical protein [Candidatus Saccharimonadales bacterium]
VDDNFAILASSSAQSALVIKQNGTGDLISASTGSIAKFTVDNNGSGSFAGDLSILGSNLSTAAGTFNIANINTLNLNIGGAATSIAIGAKSGTTTVNNNLDVAGAIKAIGGIIMPDFSQGTIPFIGTDNHIASDSANFSWDQNNKRLGIGTSTPGYRFSAVDSLSQAGKATASITNTHTADSINTVALRLNIGTSSSGTQARFATFYSDCTSENCTGSTKGNIGLSASGVNYNTGSADFAEYFSTGESALSQGDVLGLDANGKVVKATVNTPLVGVLSTTAGFIGNDTSERDLNSNKVLVGLVGQLEVKVNDQNGPIKAGDPLTSSSAPGEAAKATAPGQIIGRALEDFDPLAGVSKKIKIALNVSWYDPKAVLLNNGNVVTAYETPNSNLPIENSQDYEKLALSVQEFVSTLHTGLLEVGKISTNSLSVTTEDITIGGKTLKDYISTIVNDILNKRLASLTLERNEGAAEKTTVIVSPLAQTVSPSPQAENQNPDVASSSAMPTPAPTQSEPTPTQSINNITNIYKNVSPNASESATFDTTQAATPSATPTPQGELASGYSATDSASITPTPTTQVSPLAEPTPTSAPNNTNYALSDREPSISTEAILNTKYLIQNTKPADVASYSAEFYYVPNLKTETATFNQGLIALGPTSLTTTSINGELSIGRNMSINDNSINTLGTDLSLQPLRQGNLSIMGGLVSIDTEGNLKVTGNAEFGKNVTVNGTLSAGIISPISNSDLVIQLPEKAQNQTQTNTAQHESAFVINNASGSARFSVNNVGDLVSSGSAAFANFKIIRGAQADTSMTQTIASGSAGIATITAHETERSILTPFITDKSLIYISPVSSTFGTTPYIARQTEENPSNGTKGSFTIQISNPQLQDIKLNWVIVN